MIASRRLICLMFLSASTLAATAQGSGSEGKGSEPVGPVLPAPAFKVVADLKTRAYWREVNGDFLSAHKADAAGVNEAIRLFNEAGGRDVVLWPDSGKERTFEGEAIPCDFTLHVPGGIGLVMLNGAKTPDGLPVFEVAPTLTIFLGNSLAPDALTIPKELKIVEVSDLYARYAAGLKIDAGDGPIAASKDAGERGRRTRSATVRAQSAYHLGLLDPIPEPVVRSLRSALGDPEAYVRLSAINGLERLGARATDAVPDLAKAEAAASDEREKKAARAAIASITHAEVTPLDPIKSRIAEIQRLKSSR